MQNEARFDVVVVGSANVDFVVRVPHIPHPGETVLGGDLAIVAGGKGANQAVASARAGGAQTSMIAALGHDMLAKTVEQSLQDAGVHLVAARSSRSTGAALISLSHDASNAIAVSPGANADLTIDDVGSLQGVHWVVLQLETPMHVVTAVAEKAKASGAQVLLNAAPALPLPPVLLSFVDVLIMNEEELAAVVGGAGSIAERLGRTTAGTAIVTLGGRGCCAFVQGGYLVQPAFSVMPVDTVAAGDTFCGTLAAALSRNLDLGAALRRASAAAALTTTKPGAQDAIPQAAEVDHMLATGQEADAEALRAYCGLPPLDPNEASS